MKRSPLKRTAFKSKPRQPLKRSKMTVRRPAKVSIGEGASERELRKPKRLRSRPDPKMVAWSKTVKERDGNQCKWPGLGHDDVLAMPVNTMVRTMLLMAPCLTNDKRIDPHHIAPRSRRPDLKYELSNGISLCRTHHNWVGDHPIEAEKIGLNSFETYEAAKKRLARLKL